MRLHLLVERGAGNSTRDLQIFRVAYHPGKHFLAGRLPGLHQIVERPSGIRQVIAEIFLLPRSRTMGNGAQQTPICWALFSCGPTDLNGRLNHHGFSLSGVLSVPQRFEQGLLRTEQRKSIQVVIAQYSKDFVALA